jgi:hypothetical protein
MRSLTESRRLPLRLKPYVQESVRSYLTRLAETYGYCTPRQFCKAVTERYGLTQTDVSAALGLTAEEAARLQGWAPSYCPLLGHIPDGMTSEDFCHDVMRWCPDCLRSAPYLRMAWGAKFSSVCLEHKSTLLDCCPRCGIVQKLERAKISRCRCGFDLSNARATPARVELLASQEHFSNALGGRCVATFRRLSLSDWLRLFRFAAAIESSGKTGRLAGLQRVATATALCLRTALFLQDWPTGFHELLRKRRETAKPSFSLQRTFGRLYRWLYVELNSPAFQFLRDAFEGYLSRHWQGPVCRRNRRVKAAPGHRNTSVGRLARDSGATPAIVKHLCQLGGIDATMVTLPGGRKSWSIPEREAVKVCALIHDGINLSDAAVHLGLPRRRLRELLNAGSLTPVIRAGEGLAGAWLISKNQLDSVFKDCAARALPDCVKREDSIVALSTVLRAWRLSPGEFPSLLRAVQRGEIQCFTGETHDFRVGSLILDRVSVRRWHEEWQSHNSQHVSIDAAARLLGVKQQVAYHLVKFKALDSHILKPGTNVRRISSSAIEAFRQTYVSLAQLARNQGRSPKAVLESITVRPAIGPTVDGCRQYFFLRAELVNALPYQPR